MYKVKWLFEDIAINKEENDALIAECEKNKIEYKMISTYDYYVNNRLHNVYPDVDHECVVFYGSLNMGQKILKKNWVPGVWLNLENFKCSTYYPQYHNALFNKDFCFMNFGSLVHQKHFLFSKFGGDKKDKIFIRPDSGFKLFTGSVFEWDDFERNIKDIKGFYGVKDNDFVLVSNVKEITAEYRFVIIEDDIITYSDYKTDKTSVVPDHVISFVNQFLAKYKWRPEPVFTLDVCLDEEGWCYVLEINSFNCSGLYNCDFAKIMSEVSEYALQCFKKYHKDLEEN